MCISRFCAYYIYALDETVNGGVFNLTVNWSVKPGQTFTLIKETLDLCDLMVDVKDPCPILPGHHKQHYSGDFPKIFPKASQVAMNN